MLLLYFTFNDFDGVFLQLKDREEKLKRTKREELEMLEMRRAADELFRQNEYEKQTRRRQEADGLKNFHVDQYVRNLYYWYHFFCLNINIIISSSITAFLTLLGQSISHQQTLVIPRV